MGKERAPQFVYDLHVVGNHPGCREVQKRLAQLQYLQVETIKAERKQRRDFLSKTQANQIGGGTAPISNVYTGPAALAAIKALSEAKSLNGNLGASSTCPPPKDLAHKRNGW